MKRIDFRLKSVLANFGQNYLVKREAALAGLDFEMRREEVAKTKDRALERLEEWLELFKSKVENKGGAVYRARDGEEANRLILKILRDGRADYLLKSKSMVSEETGLNSYLESHGIMVRETDLGEWIIQIRREAPTHMVMPAIHLTREEVAQTFRRRLKRTVPPDIPTLVETARQELRRDIWRARAGLTGANALIAESGSIMVITNEGNSRLVSTIPPLRIVLASIEKVLPTVRDALLVLKLLVPSATGQRITSYVSFLASSPQRPLHIVLVDNHRSEVLIDPKFKEILRCLKCSACLNVCPVYEVLGGERYSHIYMGGIGTLLTAWIHGLRESRRLADFCLGCHRCEFFCPAKIRIADLIISLRERLNQELGKPLLKTLIFDSAMTHHSFLKKTIAPISAARLLVADRKGFIRPLPWPLQTYTRHRRLPAPTRPTLFEREKKAVHISKISQPKSALVLFGGCLVEYFYPEIGEAALQVLSRLGLKARLAEPFCCGFPSFNSGFREAAAKSLRRVFEVIQDAEQVLTLCPTCTTMLKHASRELLASERARRVAERVWPISRFLFAGQESELKALVPSIPSSIRLAYHDSCHHKYVLNAARDSRALLEKVLGQKIREVENRASCCGFGGFFSALHPEISASLLADKIEAIQKSGVDLVALDCPGCLLQIRGGLRARKSTVAVRHTVEIVEDRITGKL